MEHCCLLGSFESRHAGSMGWPSTSWVLASGWAAGASRRHCCGISGEGSSHLLLRRRAAGMDFRLGTD